MSEATGYGAAVERAAHFDRSDRGRFRVFGRAPRQMLAGVLTGSLPDPLSGPEDGVRTGRATESAALTAKGKTVSDLRVLPWWDAGAEEGFLLDVPRGGVVGLGEHLGRFLPPRMARLEAMEESGMLTVAGPEAARVLEEVLVGLPAGALAASSGSTAEHDATSGDAAGHDGAVVVIGDDPDGALRLAGTGEVWLPAWDVIGPSPRLDRLRDALADAGVPPGDPEAWDVLRVEAGRPLFGVDLDDGTIPTEAGIEDRVIDHGKGCYTGQEVIVRIRDRGRVNRHLRGLLLGGASRPGAGTSLHDAEGKEVGHVTSAARSPRYGQTVALGYVRREVEPGGEVRVGGAGGPAAEVRALGPGWGA